LNGEDPVEKLAAGAAKGGLDWGSKKIKEFVNKFKNRELVFIEDSETIELVKEIRQKSEWDLFDQYVEEKDQRLIIQMGITLRSLESDSDRLQNLRSKITKKYGARGLHLAQFVQNQILTKLVTSMVEDGYKKPDIEENIKKFLEDIDKFTLFIKNEDDVEDTVDTIITRIKANVPKVLILFGSGNASDKVEEIVSEVEEKNIDYRVKTYKEQQKNSDVEKLTIFLIKNISSIN